MTFTRALRPAVATAVLLGLAACGQQGGTATPASTSSVPAPAEGLVLRVESTGGFVSPAVTAARLPLVSLYADGRVLTEGPVAQIYPGPALPNLQEGRIDQGAVQDVVDRAVAAGVTETSDLGSPPIADATSIRFTLVTDSHTYVREAYALWETPGDGAGLTEEQQAARARLSDFLASVTDPAAEGGDSAPYTPSAIAAVVTPWTEQQDDPPQPEVAWPGPALPGESTGGLPDVSCVTATGDQAQALVTAATSASTTTPWTTADGTRWSVALRPLLPDESGCTDLND
jgi:hypothetical protein